MNTKLRLLLKELFAYAWIAYDNAYVELYKQSKDDERARYYAKLYVQSLLRPYLAGGQQNNG